ncbi:PaaI family thioesterase [Candidatus Phycosocius spiralis]|uniref:Thioesterase n=1 Tax=Candidatus Phycosocius spiralis TaxID=2815099 RepID=A0ABQ4PWS0_9PROT|nr:PaaI family thioesterase [Candidatus Phycosocius spiralis]GIU67452.1 thioesterase [Candidatus Phycosocius spiralis]
MSNPSSAPTHSDQTALRALFEAVPYAKFLGVEVELKGDELTVILPFKDSLIGNPLLPALHGGVVGALMELTAVAQIFLVHNAKKVPKIIDISIDYLRSGKPNPTYARAHVTKLGRRIANVRVEAWQFDRADPIAALHGHFLLQSDE